MYKNTEGTKTMKKIPLLLILSSALLITMSSTFIAPILQDFYIDWAYNDDTLRKLIKEKKLNHVVIVPDGNRRWARNKGMHPCEGHKKAFLDIIPSLITKALDLNISTITVSMTSPENWSRSTEELDSLTNIFINLFENFIYPLSKEKQLRIKHIGRKDRINKQLCSLLEKLESETKNNQNGLLLFGIDYGGQDEIVRAIKKIELNSKNLEHLTPQSFSNLLDTGDIENPCPDLIIRAREERLSGFMCWQLAYSEIYFTKDYFPNFNRFEFKKAIINYCQRTRTFGGNKKS